MLWATSCWVKLPWAGIPAERLQLHWQINLRWDTWHFLSQGWFYPQDEDGADETVRVKMKKHVRSINGMVAQLWCSVFKGSEWDSGLSQVPHSTCGCGVARTPILKQWTPRTWGKVPIYIPNQDWWEKFSCRCLMKETACKLAHLQWWTWTWMGPGHLPSSCRSDLVEWRAWQAHCSISPQRAGNKGHHKIGQNCSKNRYDRWLSIVSASFLLLFHYWTSFNQRRKGNITWNCLKPAINNS